MLNGKRLLELPAKTITVDELEFSEDERAIYNAVEQRAQGTSFASILTYCSAQTWLSPLQSLSETGNPSSELLCSAGPFATPEAADL